MPAGCNPITYACAMAPELMTLIEQGRRLAPGDRYELARQMLISVDEPVGDQTSVDAVWTSELRSRLDDIESGDVALVDGRETMKLARQRIATRRAGSAA